MAEEQKAALTSDEWKRGQKTAHSSPDAESGIHVHRHANDPDTLVLSSLMGGSSFSAPEIRHALAALCLYQQPFGFTQADVDLLNAIANDYGLQAFRYHGEDKGNTGDYLAGLASRIASLLPPTP